MLRGGEREYVCKGEVNKCEREEAACTGRSCKGNEGRKAAGERGGEHKEIREMQLQIQHYQAGLIAP